jgi:hypothetical protein
MARTEIPSVMAVRMRCSPDEEPLLPLIVSGAKEAHGPRVLYFLVSPPLDKGALASSDWRIAQVHPVRAASEPGHLEYVVDPAAGMLQVAPGSPVVQVQVPCRSGVDGEEAVDEATIHLVGLHGHQKAKRSVRDRQVAHRVCTELLHGLEASRRGSVHADAQQGDPSNSAWLLHGNRWNVRTRQRAQSASGVRP